MDLDKVPPSSSDPERLNKAPISHANINLGRGSTIQGSTFHGNVYTGAGGDISTLNAYKRSLSFPEMDSRYYSIKSTSENHTCMLLYRSEYTRWKNDGGLLWVQGKPGSGKSTLMRFAFDERKKSPDAHQQSRDDSQRNMDGQNKNTGNQVKSSHGKNLEVKKSITLSFFFHGRGSPLQKTILGFYRTVLFQLLEELSIYEKKLEALSRLEEFFKHQCDSRGPPGQSWQWETSQLAEDFQSVVSEVLKDCLVYLYVDALDECGEDDARRLAETFEKMIQASPVKRIEKRMNKSTGKMGEELVGRRLHICCSCRVTPPPLTRAMVKDTLHVRVERHNGYDIDHYVWSQLDPFRNTTIPKTIIDNSAGSFIWVYLVVERVKAQYSRGFSKKEIQNSIDKVPKDLEKLYEDLFQNMLGNKKSLALISWIGYAKRPLGLEELLWTMFLAANPTIKSLEDWRSARNLPCDCDSYMECTCKAMERRVQSLGHGFVEITDSNEVQFIHQSVREFFLEKGALVRLYNSTSSST